MRPGVLLAYTMVAHAFEHMIDRLNELDRTKPPPGDHVLVDCTCAACARWERYGDALDTFWYRMLTKPERRVIDPEVNALLRAEGFDDA